MWPFREFLIVVLFSFDEFRTFELWSNVIIDILYICYFYFFSILYFYLPFEILDMCDIFYHTWLTLYFNLFKRAVIPVQFIIVRSNLTNLVVIIDTFFKVHPVCRDYIVPIEWISVCHSIIVKINTSLYTSNRGNLNRSCRPNFVFYIQNK